MRFALVFIALGTIPCVAWAQTDDPDYWRPQPPRPPAPLYGPDFLFTYDHASTVAEGYLRGQGALLHARGNYLVNVQQAAILAAHAERLEMLNEDRTILQHDWKQARRAAKLAAKRVKNEAIRAARYQAAYRLGPDELNRSNGQIKWPRVLLDEQFDQERRQLDELFERYFEYAGPPMSDPSEITRTSDRLSQELKRSLAQCSLQEKQAAQKFLRGLKYEPLFRVQVL